MMDLAVQIRKLIAKGFQGIAVGRAPETKTSAGLDPNLQLEKLGLGLKARGLVMLHNIGAELATPMNGEDLMVGHHMKPMLTTNITVRKKTQPHMVQPPLCRIVRHTPFLLHSSSSSNA